MSINYIDALNKSNLLKKHAIIDIDDLCLDKRNPRFSSSTIIGNKREIKEIDIIEYLLRFGNVTELADSINQNHGLYDEEWISCYKNDKNEIIVLEGNRRVTACKILKNETLISEQIKRNIDIKSVDRDKTLPNICKVKAIIYENERDAQNYIAAKHTKPEVMKWQPIEQCNYYYEQFIGGTSPLSIAQSVGEDVKKVREKIKQFGLFKNVFDVVNQEYPEVLIEDINILPLVTKFFPPITSEKGKIGLNLSYDLENLIFSSEPTKTDIYRKILLVVGEAFFVRPKLKGVDTTIRDVSDEFRISTDEIKSRIKVEKLITDNIRIPGLYNLITLYRGSDIEDTKDKIGTTPENVKSETQKNAQENSENKEDSNKPVSESNQENSVEKIPEFFSDLKYSNLSKIDYPGITLVCEEIKKISLYNSNAAYKQFPIASAFLLRSLIEQILSERLKQVKRYDNLVKKLANGATRSPELGTIISIYLKDYQSGNFTLYWEDGNLGKEFNKCFSGLGTKDQLDTIVHNPQLIQPDHNFLNSFSKQGLKFVLQEFLNAF